MTRRPATPTSTPTLARPAVDGLAHGRERARRRAGRRRFKNTLVSGVLFLVIGTSAGVAGYYLWQFYRDEQDKQTNTDGTVSDGRSTEEWIDDLEEQPRWNGPGNPTFGVGGDDTP